MLNQTFSKKNLRNLLLSKDFRKYDIENTEAEKDKILTDVSNSICSQDFVFDQLIQKMRNGSDIFLPSRMEDEFALRKLNDNLRRLYKFKQADRFLIVKQISTLLTESVPMSVVKLDIKKFYETMPREKILEKLINEPLLSYKSKSLLKKFFEIDQIKDREGVPRGINVSSALAEIYMRDFDSKIRQLDGVYYYARYVDDIIIFTYRNPKKLVRVASELLVKETGLNLNDKKTKIKSRIACRCRPICKCTGVCKCLDKCICDNASKASVFEELSFDYLGYKFSFSDVPAHAEKLKISLATTKVKKIKTRIVRAFLDYLKNGDYSLLNKRILFLTSNHIIKINTDGNKLNAGIYFNYPHLNDFTALEDLTLFLRKIINSKNKSFGNKISTRLSANQRKELANFNFKAGFINRRLKYFKPYELNEIKKCWSYGIN